MFVHVWLIDWCLSLLWSVSHVVLAACLSYLSFTQAKIFGLIMQQVVNPNPGFRMSLQKPFGVVKDATLIFFHTL